MIAVTHPTSRSPDASRELRATGWHLSTRLHLALDPIDAMHGVVAVGDAAAARTVRSIYDRPMKGLTVFCNK